MLSGEVISLGGHSAYLEGGSALSTVKNFYIDEVLVGNYFAGAYLKMEKGKTYHIKVLLDTNNVPIEKLLSAKNLLYIQPNRSLELFDGDGVFNDHKTSPYAVNVSNLMLYER